MTSNDIKSIYQMCTQNIKILSTIFNYYFQIVRKGLTHKIVNDLPQGLSMEKAKIIHICRGQMGFSLQSYTHTHIYKQNESS